MLFEKKELYVAVPLWMPAAGVAVPLWMTAAGVAVAKSLSSPKSKMIQVFLLLLLLFQNHL